MKKKLDPTAVADEFREGSAFFAQARQQTEPAGEVEDTAGTPPTSQPYDQPAAPPTSRPTGQSTERPTGWSAAQSTTQSTVQRGEPVFDSTAVLGRPKASYITEKQDKDLDITVEKLAVKMQGRGNQKIDRSTVLRLLLEVNNITDDTTVDRLAHQLVSRLVSQLTG